MDQKDQVVYLVKYVESDEKIFQRVLPNEKLTEKQKVPNIDEIIGWPRENKGEAVLFSERVRFVLNQGFAIAKVLFETLKTNVADLQELKEKNTKQADELKTKIDEIAKLNKEISGFQDQISGLKGKLQKKDQEITRLKEDLEKAKFFRPTVYLDANNQKVISDAENLSDVQSKVILEIGYFKDKHSGEIRVPRMPKVVETVPDYLPPQITSLEKMFYFCTKFNQDISGWDVSNVQNAVMMFLYASSFNNNNKPLNWGVKTKNMEIMDNVFSHTKVFNQDITNWNTAKVYNMERMFYRATIFNQDLSRWNVANVTSYEGFATESGFANNPEKWPQFKK